MVGVVGSGVGIGVGSVGGSVGITVGLVKHPVSLTQKSPVILVLVHLHPCQLTQLWNFICVGHPFGGRAQTCCCGFGVCADTIETAMRKKAMKTVS